MYEIGKFDKVVEQLFEAYVSSSKNTNVHQVTSQFDSVSGNDDLDMFLLTKREPSQGGKIDSVMAELDVDNMEQHFATTMMRTLDQQNNDMDDECYMEEDLEEDM
ncbi:hypothetical protein GUJ93_ZPchr0013g35978 [Zizania palustris]|uniref:Uncharacterized protein n=1 Tax=Zizania palustris TaxID=103762 RepID=A0A8J5RPI4_ZIZPA|nr:hypothetical protein GUJ93_ZPchr0001g30716 [Zizania palustris]KAG8089176.1 hypothetical protein GUJ93_ZPchr0011g28384 [Zizania palustris]KAG8096780.1 hypothetical protein GUJ93_ZPchr0013g35978 [Zizania palustris]